MAGSGFNTNRVKKTTYSDVLSEQVVHLKIAVDSIYCRDAIFGK